jgi:hypothetical protein
VLTPGLPPAHPTPALVAHAQGGLTLGPERGELAADFWSLGADPKHGPINSFRNSARRPPRGVLVIDWAIIIVVASTYLCIHLIGWNFTFPTTVERQLWRSAAMVLLGSMVSYWLIFIIYLWLEPVICRLFGFSKVNNGVEFLRLLPLWVQYLGAAIWIGSYGTARLYLIVEAFISLRALPLAAYETVTWSSILPHA